MAKKKFDPKAKAKRQKMIAAVGGVILVAVLAFQVPRTMKMMKSDETTASSTPPTSTTTAGSTPLAPPALDGSATAGTAVASPTVTSSDGVSDPSNPLPPSAGQLVSFSKFKGKDPFHQQIVDCGSSSSDGAPAGGSACAGLAKTAAKGAASKAASKADSTPGVATAKGLTGSSAAAAPAKVTNATITVNGLPSVVSVGTSFPAAAPVFTLVSLTPRAAKIGILDGTYESGAPTVTLAKAKTVTLMNTADGTRYVLRLVSVA
jgi:hypothetical protein